MSTFSVSCPSCHHALEADDSNVGMMVECPLCHHRFEIRHSSASPQPAMPQGYSAPAAPSYPAPYPAPSSGTPTGYAPYPQPAAPQQGYAPGALPPGYTAPRRAVSWTTALVFQIASLALAVLYFIVSLVFADRYWISDTEAILLGILGFGLVVALILNLVFSMILHYKCWKALPVPFNNVSAMGPVTPGKAVGFLFIPFFNFYWLFPSYAGLGKGWNDWAVATGKVAPTHPQLPPRTPMPALGMALAVLSLLNLFLAWVPFVGLMIGIAVFVLWIFFYKNVVHYANCPDAWPV